MLFSWTSGHYYHLYNRGARGLTIFPDEQSYLHVIQRAKRLCAELCRPPRRVMDSDCHRTDAWELPQLAANQFSR